MFERNGSLCHFFVLILAGFYLFCTATKEKKVTKKEKNAISWDYRQISLTK
jgi:hypothetical protein